MWLLGDGCRCGFTQFEVVLYKLLQSNTYESVFRVISMLHCILILFEDPLPANSSVHWKWQLAVEVFCGFAYMIDITMNICSSKFRYVTSAEGAIAFSAKVLVITDVAIAGAFGLSGQYFKYNRILGRPARPFVFVSHLRPLMNELLELLRALPTAIDIGMQIMFFLALYALILFTLYSGRKVEMFQSFTKAMHTLYVFADGDNHPDVVESTYGGEDRWIVFILFLSWMSIG